MYREEALAANLMCFVSNVCSREQLFATPTVLSLQRRVRRVRASKTGDNFIKHAAEDVFYGISVGRPIRESRAIETGSGDAFLAGEGTGSLCGP